MAVSEVMQLVQGPVHAVSFRRRTFAISGIYSESSFVNHTALITTRHTRDTVLHTLRSYKLCALQNQQAAALYEEAQQAMAQDNFNKARRKLREAHQTDPQVTHD